MLTERWQYYYDMDMRARGAWKQYLRRAAECDAGFRFRRSIIVLSLVPCELDFYGDNDSTMIDLVHMVTMTAHLIGSHVETL
eukprot:scaffold324393_cov59-Tisochrysis_lutea.AAC.1